MTLAHVVIILYFMQCVEEYLVALKDFDYSCSLGYKRPFMSKSKDIMNIAKDLNLHDLILSFLLLFRTNIGLKSFLRTLYKVLILCDFLNLGCLRIIATSRQPLATAFRLSY